MIWWNAVLVNALFAAFSENTKHDNIRIHAWSLQAFSAVSVCSCMLTAHTHTLTRLTALCPGLPRWASTRNVKPIWILLEQETVSGSGISWAICKPAPRSRQTTMPTPQCSILQQKSYHVTLYIYLNSTHLYVLSLTHRKNVALAHPLLLGCYCTLLLSFRGLTYTS